MWICDKDEHCVDCPRNYPDEECEHWIEVVPVVRCRECKHYNAGFECLAEGYGIERDPDWFCADGEREVQE